MMKRGSVFSSEDRKTEFEIYVSSLIDLARNHLDQSRYDRVRAIEYYNGDMNDLPVKEGRSSAVSNELRTAVKDLLPSIMRILFGNEKIVEYKAVRPEHEQYCDQATEYVNRVIVPESHAEDAIHDAIHDAILLKTGILKWDIWDIPFSETRDLPPAPETLLQEMISAEPDKFASYEEIADPYEDNGEIVRTLRVTSQTSEKRITLTCIPRDSFLMAPGFDNLRDSPIVGDAQVYTRSELAEMGVDSDIIADLSAYTQHYNEEERYARDGRDYTQRGFEYSEVNEPILTYCLYVKEDLNGDGIAEIYKCLVAEGGSRDNRHGHLFLQEPVEVDEYPYSEVKIERDAHSFEGRSLAEDIVQLQRINTALLRETMDNIYAQNRPFTMVNPSYLTEDGMEAIYDPEFGRPITVNSQEGMEAVKFLQYPFVASETFNMMNYIRKSVTDRTGISDASGGLEPGQLMNVTATAVQSISDSATATAEMILRTLSQGGIKTAFKGILRLVVNHIKGERFIRNGRDWKSYDPSGWDSDMGCEINIGLGAGSKQRDLAVMMNILGIQDKLIGQFGVDNPFVRPSQYYNTITKIAEISGLPSSEPYFMKPDDQQTVDVLNQRSQAQASPEKMLQLEKQSDMMIAKQRSESLKEIEVLKLEMRKQLETELARMKLDTQIQIEEAQRRADISVKEAELASKMTIERMKIEADIGKALREQAENDESEKMRIDVNERSF